MNAERGAVRSARRLTVSLLSSLLVASAVTILATGCSGEGPKSVKVVAGPMPEGETWTGVYFHRVFGFLHLQEEGSNVVGRWQRTDKSHWGELSGTRRGNVLHFTWKEHKIGMVGAAATTHGKGYFVYKVNKDNIGLLQGEYGLNDAEGGADWTNLKQPRTPVDLKSIGGEDEGVTPGQLSSP